MQNPYEHALQRVAHMRQQLSLLGAVDELESPKNLLELALNEVDELREEAEQEGTSNYNPEALQDEGRDAAVFLMSAILAHFQGELLKQKNPISSVNGYGKYSYAIDRLPEVIQDAQDDPYAILEAIARIDSILNHRLKDQSLFGLALYGMDATIAKVLKNRPPELYSTYCPILNRVLEGREILLKHIHLEKGTRMIRDQYGRDMDKLDWKPHFELLINWTQSEQALKELEFKLNNSNGHAVVALQDSGLLLPTNGVQRVESTEETIIYQSQ